MGFLITNPFKISINFKICCMIRNYYKPFPWVSAINFLPWKIFQVRKVDMLEGVSILRSEKVKDELVLDGNDIELVSRSAALINQVPFLHNQCLHMKNMLFIAAFAESSVCIVFNRNAMSRTKIFENSLMVSTSVRREHLLMRNELSNHRIIVVRLRD